jgi:hypothetical protein
MVSYYDAEFKTKGFTLKAPKTRVKDTPPRVKVTVVCASGTSLPPNLVHSELRICSAIPPFQAIPEFPPHRLACPTGQFLL